MKTALITGGTRGIGFGVAKTLINAGWSVIATGVSSDEVCDCPTLSNLETRVLDVTDQADVDQLMATIDRLDGLVNCAGTLMRGAEYDIDTFQKVVNINLVGTMRMCVGSHDLLSTASGSMRRPR